MDQKRADDEWREFLLHSHAARRTRRVFRFLPHDPRCTLCYVPFAGPLKLVLGSMGFRRFDKNPRFCTSCVKVINKRQRGGAEIELSMLFADVRGSTTLAEQASTSDFRRLMDRFYETGTRVLIERDALIERFMGDQVVGYFIPAFAGAAHARQAIDSARALLVATGHGKSREPWVPVGVGIHTGIAWVGTVGDPGRMVDFTALGDAVNIAARLASSAGAGEIFASEACVRAAGLPTEVGQRRALEVKGKSVALDVRVLTADAQSLLG